MASPVLADRYELGRQLGRGGMATVYEARDKLLDREVAVKLLRVDGDATARRRFAAEARAAASLTHPHAVAVYDVSTADDRPFIVMELVRGTTLEHVIDEEGQMPTPQVVAVGCQVLDALHAAHRRGLVHRDVKPANILLPGGVVPSKPEELPGVKLADFGIAKATHEATVGLTMAGQVIGTPRYLSPEQVRGQRATPQSDLYATAVVVYEMLAGRPPFEHDSAVGLALAHREDEPPPLDEIRSGLDRNLVALVHRALSKDPADRPADAVEMRDALQRSRAEAAGTQLLPGPDASTQLVGHQDAPPATVPPPAPRQPTAPGRSGTWMRWLVVLALATVLAFLAAQWLTRPGGPDATPTAQPQTAPADAGEPAGAGAAPADEPAQQDQPADGQVDSSQPEPGAEPSAPPVADEPPPTE